MARLFSVAFALWMASVSSAAVIHIRPKLGAVFNPDSTLVEPANVDVSDPFEGVRLPPRAEPYSVRIDFLMTIEELTDGQVGFGNALFDIELDRLAQNADMPGWQPDYTTIDLNGALPGGIVPKWHDNGDYGLDATDLHYLLIGTFPRIFGSPIYDSRRTLGLPPFEHGNGYVVNQLGEYVQPNDGEYAGSLLVDVPGKAGSEGSIQAVVIAGSTYNADLVLSTVGTTGGPPAEFRIQVVPEPAAWQLAIAAFTVLLFRRRRTHFLAARAHLA
jgi:hypothetical protein